MILPYTKISGLMKICLACWKVKVKLTASTAFWLIQLIFILSLLGFKSNTEGSLPDRSWSLNMKIRSNKNKSTMSWKKYTVQLCQNWVFIPTHAPFRLWTHQNRKACDKNVTGLDVPQNPHVQTPVKHTFKTKNSLLYLKLNF